MIDLGNTYFPCVTESARFFFVEEDIFRGPTGISFFSWGGIVIELDLNTQLFERFFRR